MFHDALVLFAERQNIDMDWYRMKHTIRMYLIRNGADRANYIRKHKIFYECGKNNMFMFRKIPLYPKLIKIHNNVWIASNVTFITHDVIHKMLNNKNQKESFQEKLGCIEIEDNVFVGANTTILYDIKISKNTIIGAGSLINKSILESGAVWAGVPARRICSIQEYENKLMKRQNSVIVRDKSRLAKSTVDEYWGKFEEAFSDGQVNKNEKQEN